MQIYSTTAVPDVPSIFFFPKHKVLLVQMSSHELRGLSTAAYLFREPGLNHPLTAILNYLAPAFTEEQDEREENLLRDPASWTMIYNSEDPESAEKDEGLRDLYDGKIGLDAALFDMTQSILKSMFGTVSDWQPDSFYPVGAAEALKAIANI